MAARSEGGVAESLRATLGEWHQTYLRKTKQKKEELSDVLPWRGWQ